ncbi:hypothetical protein [Rhodococcus sp. MEB064]|uniref:hypothetical protein n=1 Tax=Rhodococcus sp. MEB064 TaxID=1587522 RepID=UPI0012E00CA3|nr:hypothetical protein [Rhodococcus sp. MEB064]
MQAPAGRRHSPPRALVAITILAAALLAAACSADSEDRAGFVPVPTRAAQPAPSSPTPGSAIEVADFTVLPTFGCLDETPPRALVTVGWTAPSATAVEITLDGRVLPAGIGDQLPYQVPAGGPTGIGASVVFACDGAPGHTIDVTWTADGVAPVTRTATITKEPTDG